jgi:hypothetical protein
VVLYDDDDDAKPTHLSGQSALADLDASATLDAGCAGTISVEATVPSRTVVGVPSTTRPPTVDRALIVPALGARNRKPMCHAVKRSDPGHHVDQVMIQVELPPYRRPHSLLDLVAFEIACLKHFTGCCRLELM